MTLGRFEDSLDYTVGMNAYVNEKPTKIELTYKLGTEVCTYVARLDCDDAITDQITGREAYRIFRKWVKVPETPYMKDIAFSASPLLAYNPRFERQWLTGYYYDLNSAYASVMVNSELFPDTSVAPTSGFVPEGHIGFIINICTDRAELVYPGNYANWIFPMKHLDGIKEFALHWYDIKLNSKNPVMRAKAKNILNYCVGYLQNINPFIRAYIVCKCNEYMSKIMEANRDTWCICNTDAIVTTKPIEGLTIGNNIGEFKFKTDKFAYRGDNYQFGSELKYRGVPKSWFKEDFDITVDAVPQCNNKYYYDVILCEVRLCEDQ